MFTITNVILIAVAIALMIAHSILVRFDNPVWSAVIPLAILTAAFYAYFIMKMAVNYRNVLFFMFPFCWCLEECYRKIKGKND